MSGKRLREWQSHVERGDTGGRLAWCGYEFQAFDSRFLNAEHALLTVAQQQRRQPCPACTDALMAVLKTVGRH